MVVPTHTINIPTQTRGRLWHPSESHSGRLAPPMGLRHRDPSHDLVCVKQYTFTHNLILSLHSGNQDQRVGGRQRSLLDTHTSLSSSSSVSRSAHVTEFIWEGGRDKDKGVPSLGTTTSRTGLDRSTSIDQCLLVASSQSSRG